jgi:AraC-like DNA-binding protein
MKLHIKNMVSYRCQLMVKSQLDKLGISFISVNLGEVFLKNSISTKQLEQFKTDLIEIGLELIEDNSSILVERVKSTLISKVYMSEEPIKEKLSDYLSKSLEHDYTYLANVFSKETGDTIEHYIISLKIERVKELLIYDELSVKEISYLLNYSSDSHLSAQFKKVTGMSPTAFLNLKNKGREYLSAL